MMGGDPSLFFNFFLLMWKICLEGLVVAIIEKIFFLLFSLFLAIFLVCSPFLYSFQNIFSSPFFFAFILFFLIKMLLIMEGNEAIKDKQMRENFLNIIIEKNFLNVNFGLIFLLYYGQIKLKKKERKNLIKKIFGN